MKYRLFFLFFWLAGLVPSPSACAFSDAARITLVNDQLLIENGAMRVVYAWNQGLLIFREFYNKKDNIGWHLKGDIPDFNPGLLALKKAALSVEWRQDPVSPGQKFLQGSIDMDFGQVIIRRIIVIRENLPVLSHQFYFKGTWPGDFGQAENGRHDRDIIESDELPEGGSDPYLLFLPLGHPHWKLEFVRFMEATDHNNTLVQTEQTIPYRFAQRKSANLIMATDNIERMAFFVLKDSPLSESQYAYSGYDFEFDSKGLILTGLGISTEELNDQSWQRAYGYSMGITDNSRLSLRKALRAFQKSQRVYIAERDAMILSNTWGDRSKDSRMNENFILNEIAAAVTLGITHVQLDDGWQSGLSKNSASKQGIIWDNWQEEDWKPHPTRFPNGFEQIMHLAGKHEIELCLWFNPSKTDEYANWRRDADILVDLYKQYGIRVFKIDGIELTGKTSEENLRRLFDRVVRATDGMVVFNLDVTAGRRMGYHFFTEYGNIFLENRYSDWGNYYPHWTLRNLWMLSEFVPPERLQIEFINKWRNADKYKTEDPLTPGKIPWEYQVAITMMAQPLAWMELSQLPEEAYRIKGLIDVYKEHMTRIHSGTILPIGQEPDGFNWTGFQSVTNDKEGYLLIFRENNPDDTAWLSTWFSPMQAVQLIPIAGNGTSQEIITDREGNIQVSLPSPFSFSLYKYILLP